MQTIVPNNAEVLAIAKQANAQHLHIIMRNGRTLLSPTVPQGWTKLHVNHKGS